MDALIDGHWEVMAEYDPTEHHVKLVVDEWGPWYRDGSAQTPEHLFEQTPTLRDALFSAMTLDTFNHHADKVRMANCSQLINCLNSPFLAYEERFCVTPVGHVFAMYAEHQGGIALTADIDSPAIDYLRDDRAAQFWGLRGSASLHDRVLVLTITNPHTAQAREAQIGIRGARVSSGVATTLTSPEIHATKYLRPARCRRAELPYRCLPVAQPSRSHFRPRRSTN